MQMWKNVNIVFFLLTYYVAVIILTAINAVLYPKKHLTSYSAKFIFSLYYIIYILESLILNPKMRQ